MQGGVPPGILGSKRALASVGGRGRVCEGKSGAGGGAGRGDRRGPGTGRGEGRMGEGGHTGSAELAVLPSSSSSSTRRSQFFFPAVSDLRVSVAVLGVGVDKRGVDGPATDEVIGVDEASREGQLIDSALASMSSSWTISSSADSTSRRGGRRGPYCSAHACCSRQT